MSRVRSKTVEKGPIKEGGFKISRKKTEYVRFSRDQDSEKCMKRITLKRINKLNS